MERTFAVAGRSENWNAGLAKDLRDPAFVREFLMASIDEGVDVRLALEKVICAVGARELAAMLYGPLSADIARQLKRRHVS